jgi:hypothetical protein
MLVVIQNILEWGWLPFLTEEFAQVVPWISMSLVVSIVANLVYEFNDTRIVKSTGQILINLISILITYQIFTVFPFDFSAYDFSWALVTRILMVLAMVGAGIGVLTEAMRLAAFGLGDPSARIGHVDTTGGLPGRYRLVTRLAIPAPEDRSAG